MYPYHSLPENLAAFSATLRRLHGFRIGPRELQDGVRALDVIDLADEVAVRNVLRPILCSTAADSAKFDPAFDEFFHRSGTIPRIDLKSRSSREQGDDAADVALARTTHRSVDRPDEEPSTTASHELGPVLPLAIDDAREHATGSVRSSYSPLDAEGDAPDLRHNEASWRAAASAFVAALRLGLSRRWRPAPRGQRFDLRRTLRHSLHTGGEAVTSRWLARPRRRPHIVVFVDGSRSMGVHAQVALDIAVAIAAVTADVEVFTFSTTIRQVSRDVRRAAAGERRRLEHLQHAWCGGTTIGACLQMFLRRFGERVLRRDTVVVFASDGLDVGAPAVLREGMARLHRRSAGVIWLNPLLDTPGYEPTALGMSTARPYVSTFAWATDPAGLLRLSRTVRLRIR